MVNFLRQKMPPSAALIELADVPLVTLTRVLRGLPADSREAVLSCHEHLQRSCVRVALEVHDYNEQLETVHIAKAPRHTWSSALLHMPSDMRIRIWTELPLSSCLSLSMACHEFRELSTTAEWADVCRASVCNLLRSARDALREDHGIMMQLPDRVEKVIRRTCNELSSGGLHGAEGLQMLLQVVAPKIDPPLVDICNSNAAACVQLVVPTCMRVLPLLYGTDSLVALLSRQLAAGEGGRSLQSNYHLLVHGPEHPLAPTVQARQDEVDQILLLGCLGKAAAPYVPMLLRKLFPCSRFTAEEDNVAYEDAWDSISVKWTDDLSLTDASTSSDTIPGLVVEAVCRVAPLLTEEQALGAVAVLTPHLKPPSDRRWMFEHDSSYLAIMALGALSSGSVAAQGVVRRCSTAVLSTIPIEYVESLQRDFKPVSTNDMVAIVSFVGKAGLTKHLELLMWTLADDDESNATFEAALALERLWPKLDVVDRARVVTFVRKFAESPFEQLHGERESAVRHFFDFIDKHEGRGRQHSWVTYWKRSSCEMRPSCACYECKKEVCVSDMRAACQPYIESSRVPS